MFVGALRVRLHLHGNQSLKGKRKILRSTIDRIRSKFHTSVAEVGDNDVHQSGVIGVAVIGNEAGHVDSMLAKIAGFVENTSEAMVASIETEIIPMGDGMGRGARDSSLRRGSSREETEDDWEEDEAW